MADEEGKVVAEAVIPPPPKRRRSRLGRWLLWLGVIVVAIAGAALGAVAILLHRAEPILRASLIDTLQNHLHGRVELDSLRVSILDGFWVEGRGLRIWLPSEAIQAIQTSGEPAGPAPWQSQPWIVVDTLRFHASWRIVPGKPIEVSVVHVEGARVLLPPKEDRPNLKMAGSGDGGDAAPAPQQAGSAQAGAGQSQPAGKPSLFKMPQIDVRRIECQDAHLTIERTHEPGKPVKVPLEFAFTQVTLVPDGAGGRIAYSVNMTNPKPVGTIHATGHLGHWTPSDPGALPVDGDYHFDRADLSTIKGIAGILSSTGHFSGTLHKIEANGVTQTPDFRLERVGKDVGLPLTTRFHAIVDGTNGDTWLQPVDATLGRTHIVARGHVVRAGDLIPGRKGHDIVLQLKMDRGRIEDILHISSTSETAFVTGALTLESSFHLPANPPGADASLWDRLQLNGQFHLSQARFGNAKMQSRIEQLSLRGQGKPGEVKSTDPDTVLSEIQGHFKLGDGMLELPDLVYQVPGAQILAHGTYGLQAGALNFEGEARMDATLSQMVGGWKGILLKPVDRYLRKNGAGTDVPIHVSGTRKDPEFGVEFSKLGKKDKPEQPQQPQEPQ